MHKYIKKKKNKQNKRAKQKSRH